MTDTAAVTTLQQWTARRQEIGRERAEVQVRAEAPRSIAELRACETRLAELDREDKVLSTLRPVIVNKQIQVEAARERERQARQAIVEMLLHVQLDPLLAEAAEVIDRIATVRARAVALGAPAPYAVPDIAGEVAEGLGVGRGRQWINVLEELDRAAWDIRGPWTETVMPAARAYLADPAIADLAAELSAQLTPAAPPARRRRGRKPR